ncbi:CIA30 family protein [Desulfosediminicola sp.]|uniref:CIA30 family protein n=1 Tax=Desulfosediminicola sp. TaxID=2886825 RepID=UPI003AF2E973
MQPLIIILALQWAMLLCMVQPVLAAQKSSLPSDTEMVLFDFENPVDLQDWLVVNDGVMGGLSRGEIIRTDSGTAVFQGILLLENNGGFSSTRTLHLPYRLDGFDGIVLRVRGDGNTYQFRLRLDGSFDGVAYRYKFQTEADKWTTVEVPFSECVPVFRGRKLSGVDPVSPEKIQQIGFLISEKQVGPFRLEVDLISAYRR